MEKIWTPRYVVDIAGAAGSPVVFPQFLDLAIREDASFPEVWSAAKDGTLWRHGGGPFPRRLRARNRALVVSPAWPWRSTTDCGW